MTDKATPRPWRISLTRGRLDSGLGVRGIASHDNANVAWVTMACPEFDANADLIVRAVNSHDALVEALRAFAGREHDQSDLICHHGITTADKCNDCTRYRNAWAALRAAGVEP